MAEALFTLGVFSRCKKNPRKCEYTWCPLFKCHLFSVCHLTVEKLEFQLVLNFLLREKSPQVWIGRKREIGAKLGWRLCSESCQNSGSWQEGKDNQGQPFWLEISFVNPFPTSFCGFREKRETTQKEKKKERETNTGGRDGGKEEGREPLEPGRQLPRRQKHRTQLVGISLTKLAHQGDGLRESWFRRGASRMEWRGAWPVDVEVTWLVAGRQHIAGGETRCLVEENKTGVQPKQLWCAGSAGQSRPCGKIDFWKP